MRNKIFFLLFIIFFVNIIFSQEKNSEKSDIIKKISSVPLLETENICECVKTTRMGELLLAPNKDGKTWDILQIYFPEYYRESTVVIIDLSDESIKSIKVDGKWNLHLCKGIIAPNRIFFIRVQDNRERAKIFIYKPEKNELITDAVKIPNEILGETNPFVLGSDGKIYLMGQYPNKSATCVQVDPDTFKVIFYGPIGPTHTPEPCYAYSGAVDDRYIYIASGKVPWYLIVFDKIKKKWKILAETEKYGGFISIYNSDDGIIASIKKNSESPSEKFWLYKGELIPFGEIDKKPPKIEKKLITPVPPLIDKTFADPDENGWVEIRIKTENQEWKLFRFQVPLYPIRIYRLKEMPDGRLFGTAGAYLGNFIYDPREKSVFI